MPHTAELADTDPLLERIVADYREMPRLCLTRPQMQRLWGLDRVVCDHVVEALVAAHVLRQTADGTYVAAACDC